MVSKPPAKETNFEDKYEEQKLSEIKQILKQNIDEEIITSAKKSGTITPKFRDYNDEEEYIQQSRSIMSFKDEALTQDDEALLGNKRQQEISYGTIKEESSDPEDPKRHFIKQLK